MTAPTRMDGVSSGGVEAAAGVTCADTSRTDQRNATIVRRTDMHRMPIPYRDITCRSLRFRYFPVNSVLRSFGGRLLPSGQGRPVLGVGALALLHERLDDLQCGPRLALRAAAAEVGGELAVRAQDFLSPHLTLCGRFGFRPPLSCRLHRDVLAAT